MIRDRKEYSRKYREKNKEKIRERQKKWVEENRDKIRLANKKWADMNPEKVKAAAKKFRQTEKGRLYMNAQYLKYSKKKYYSDPEFKKKLYGYNKKWRERNPERVKVISQTAYRKRLDKRPELKDDWLEEF